ncbi:CRISPR-associated protein Csm3 [Synechococcales cyanobacterium C]|uniref:CRISPR-associated protein Csm3 n=1 Tax=Petrachloros mirabilis ULC683 TaxID=2781853 RepID=A0A8K2AA18_9CYAN|nr:RAMP superfamily CRISPR-associated protein [Petrachloros mirabilis]NCJ08675.1 CRISPR-associated protein Csm3 [Petrachloros mirabilis ULC683]
MVQLRTLLQPSTDTLTLTAIIDTALCIGAGGSSGSLADKPILRAVDGRLLIPGSHLKGRLRHECEKLARGLGWPICDSPVAETMCPQIGTSQAAFQRPDYAIGSTFIDGHPQYHCLICQLFGNPALPSRLVVEDLVCDLEAESLPEVLLPGVTLNRRRRTAEDQRLYFLETSPVNAQLPFTGRIYLEANCPVYAKALILAALHHIHALGGSKSAGLGWLTWQVTEPTPDETAWNRLATVLSVGETP